MIFNQIKTAGNAFKEYGTTKSVLKNFGKRSVGESEMKTKARTMREIFRRLVSELTNHRTQPDSAIIKVGDSAL